VASPVVGFLSFESLHMLCNISSRTDSVETCLSEPQFHKKLHIFKVYYHTKFQSPKLIRANGAPLSEICVFIILILLMGGITWLKIKGSWDIVIP
jgi:hypothetical protein